jgi:hypothetical protein
MTTYIAPTYPASYVAGDVINFNYTGASQTWNSLNASYIKIELYGAAGGIVGDNPGYGGYSYGFFYPAQNTNYYLYVGGIGQNAYQNTTGVQTSVAGFNGGGEGGLGVSGSNIHRGAGGGGATDFRSGGTALSNRILVAGGGGGSGTKNVALTAGSYGGAGGGTSILNPNGSPGYTSSYRGFGYGGTQSAGGNGGASGSGGSTAGAAGTLGVGGQGGLDAMSYTQYNYAGPGGGGGYYGGGGGGAGGIDGRGNAGAGGGSGYVNTGAGGQIAIYGGESGVNNNNGSAVITILA